MAFTFTIGYIAATVGALGVSFVVAAYDTDTEKWLGDGLIYKETSLGNAISDYRGKRVEIYKTIFWFPIIEWRTHKREYFNYITYHKTLTVDYKPTENKIYLSASMPLGKDKHIENWADTLNIAQ